MISSVVKFRYWFFAVILHLALLLPALSAAPSSPLKERAVVKGFEAFNPKAAPAAVDWRIFHQADGKFRRSLWEYQAARHLKLGDWSWGWRLGWVRACATSQEAYCMALLEVALFDDALLVRSEAAKRMGERFEGTGNEKAIGLLVKSFADARNLRHRKPLYVRERILFALKLIGGAAAQSAASRLAASEPKSKAYWVKLNRG